MDTLKDLLLFIKERKKMVVATCINILAIDWLVANLYKQYSDCPLYLHSILNVL